MEAIEKQEGSFLPVGAGTTVAFLTLISTRTADPHSVSEVCRRTGD